jgi:hypothetical protein
MKLTMFVVGLVALPLLSLGCKRSSSIESAAAASAPPAPAAPQGPSLQVSFDGKPLAGWSRDKLAKIPLQKVTNRNGEESEGWSLRDVSRSLVGAGVRVAALIDEEGTRVELDPKAWSDSSSTPFLRTNHHGEFKMQWVQNGAAGEAVIKHIQRVELAR